MQARWYEPTVERYLAEDPNAYVDGDANLYNDHDGDPVNSIEGLLTEDDSTFWHNYSYYLNLFNNDPGAGGVAFGVGKSLGWAGAAVGTVGAGIITGVGGLAELSFGTVTAYAGTQGAIAAVETGVEIAATNYFGGDVGISGAFAIFGKNFAINLATGGFGKAATTTGRVGLFAARQGIEIASETAFDVGYYGRNLGSSLLINAIGSVGGEALARGIARSGVLHHAYNGVLLGSAHAASRLNGLITFAPVDALLKGVADASKIRRLLIGSEKIFRKEVEALATAHPGLSNQSLGTLAGKNVQPQILALADRLGLPAKKNFRIDLPDGLGVSLGEGIAAYRVADIALSRQRFELELTLENAADFAEFTLHKQGQLADYFLSGFTPVVINAARGNRVLR